MLPAYLANMPTVNVADSALDKNLLFLPLTTARATTSRAQSTAMHARRFLNCSTSFVEAHSGIHYASFRGHLSPLVRILSIEITQPPPPFVRNRPTPPAPLAADVICEWPLSLLLCLGRRRNEGGIEKDRSLGRDLRRIHRFANENVI